MRQHIAAIVAGVALLAAAWILPDLRRTMIRAATTMDATPSEPVALPAADGAGLPTSPQTRVVLVDGLTADAAGTMGTWQVLCANGATLTIDVGFPTVSLPVEIALWTGLTQQQTGVVANRAFDAPIKGIPSQVPGSIAIAENHGYIVRALGFATAEPKAEPTKPMDDANDKAWDSQWFTLALEAVRSPSPLVFVHILRVDVAGHKVGLGEGYDKAVREVDPMLDKLFQADPSARWFLLSDHGHIAGGGHGGEERHVRQVTGCMHGPGIKKQTSGLIHIVDVGRMIADSVGVTLDPASRARPFEAAMATQLGPDQALPAMPIVLGAFAVLLLVAGLIGEAWGVRRWWLTPFWFVGGCGLVLLVRGMPTWSTPFIYKPEGRDMWTVWAAALPFATAAAWFGLQKTSLLRVLAALLAFPLAATAAVITAAGAWPTLFGADIAPVVPRFTAWASPLLLLLAHGAGAVGLAVLANGVHRAFGRREPPEPPRSEPAAG